VISTVWLFVCDIWSSPRWPSQWATGGKSDSWQTDFHFGADFCGNIWEAWPNLSQQEPASEGNVTQTNVVLSLHVHTIESKKDIKLCYKQLEVNQAHGRLQFGA
jgi:hypothetical protein